jgi:aryl-alcohol dehydrogenase-like predicted oxidoreductase
LPGQTSIALRTLGASDLKVSPIGLGVMQFSGANGAFRYMFNDLAQGQMNSIVQAALDGGVNWFDTAEMYGRGHSEHALSQALKAAGKADDEVIVGTKWMPLFRTAANIRKTIDDRLRALGGYSIDLYMIHQPWSFSSPEAEMEAMADLVEAGKIRAVGVSNFNADQMRRAHRALAKRGLPLAVNQMQYSLLHRHIEANGVLDAAKELGVTIVAWGPLGSGLLTGEFHKDPKRIRQTPVGRRMRLSRQIQRSQPVVEALQELAIKHEVEPAQVALNWIIHARGDTIVAIPGASRTDQAEQNAGAMHFRLTESELQRLSDLSQAFL